LPWEEVKPAGKPGTFSRWAFRRSIDSPWSTTTTVSRPARGVRGGRQAGDAAADDSDARGSVSLVSGRFAREPTDAPVDARGRFKTPASDHPP
jgi:hypothetical protein